MLTATLILAYFIPALVAWGRKNHTGAIFALNLFLGWTLIGWVVALVLALWSNHADERDAPPLAVGAWTLNDWRSEIRRLARR